MNVLNRSLNILCASHLLFTHGIHIILILWVEGWILSERRHFKTCLLSFLEFCFVLFSFLVEAKKCK